jgi:hypothetical protein
MTRYDRWWKWAAVWALGLAGLIGGAATVHAASAVPATRTAAGGFELTFETALTPPLFLSTEGGTFRSGAPFCPSGRFVEEPNGPLRWRFTCDDGTGSLTVVVQDPSSGWQIVDGSGSYAGFRGMGGLQGEQLCKPWLDETCDPGRPIPWRGTLVGVVDRDAVAPTIAFTRVTATKLRRPAGTYALRLGIALRDDVADNPVTYTVRACATTVDACAGRVELARRFGMGVTGAFSTTLRIRPLAGARTVLVQLTGVDPVGNVVSISRALKLPR